MNGATTIGTGAIAPVFKFEFVLADDDLKIDDQHIFINGDSTRGVFTFNIGAAKNTLGLPAPSIGACRAQVTQTVESNVDGEHVGGLLRIQHGDSLVTREEAQQLAPS